MATAAQAAAHIFISISRFRDLVSQGTIKHQPNGKYDLDKVREQYIRNLQRVATGRGGEEGGTQLTKQRAEYAKEQTLSMKLKNAIVRGDYVSLELFAKKVDAMILVVRERILTIPGKLADKLSMRTRDEIDLILREEVYEALNELSGVDDRGGGDRQPPSQV
jgi:phage terminase Nu1 subunit (DNA packaging protein)